MQCVYTLRPTSPDRLFLFWFPLINTSLTDRKLNFNRKYKDDASMFHRGFTTCSTCRFCLFKFAPSALRNFLVVSIGWRREKKITSVVHWNHPQYHHHPSYLPRVCPLRILRRQELHLLNVQDPFRSHSNLEKHRQGQHFLFNSNGRLLPATANSSNSSSSSKTPRLCWASFVCSFFESSAGLELEADEDITNSDWGAGSRSLRWRKASIT